MQPGKTPFLRLLFPLCAGIIFSEVCYGEWIPGLVCLALAFIALIISLLKKPKGRDLIFGAATMLFLSGAGYFLHHTEEIKYSHLKVEKQSFLIRLNDYPVKKKNGYSFECTMVAAGSDSLSWRPKGKLLIYYNADTIAENLTPGDLLVIKMKPMPLRNNGNPCEFNYQRYMKGRGFLYYGFIRPADIKEYSLPHRRNIIEQSAIISHKMVESFAKAGLRGEELGLVTALTIGDKELLDKEQLTSFSRAGVMHVMAVSGLHVGMISLFISSLLFFIKRRWIIIKTIIILLVLWSFAFITGLTPSVMRATIMFSFLQIGPLIKREGSGMNILLASAFILLVARPSMLFEAGFQLSYLAVIFIIAFYEPLYILLKTKSKIINFLWQMAAISIVAQCGTFPLTVGLFNSFPLLFLFSNIIIVPLSFFITILALILFPVSGVYPVATALAWVLSHLSDVTFDFTSFVSSLPHSVIADVGMTSAGTITLTLALALLFASLLKVARISLRPFLVLMTLYFLIGATINITEGRKEGVIVYNIHGGPLPSIQSGRHLSVITSADEIPDEVKKHACTRGLQLHCLKTEGNAVAVSNADHKFAVLASGDPADYDLPEVEMIISQGRLSIGNNYVMQDSSPPLLVASSVRMKMNAGIIKTHSISEMGALIMLRERDNR